VELFLNLIRIREITQFPLNPASEFHRFIPLYTVSTGISMCRIGFEKEIHRFGKLWLAGVGTLQC
jgi:hypothetical protein